MSFDTAEFEGISVLQETEKAIKCEIEGEEFWIPKSVIHEDSEVYEEGTEGSLIIKRWWAEKNGLT